jgi:hypothetical protein
MKELKGWKIHAFFKYRNQLLVRKRKKYYLYEVQPFYFDYFKLLSLILFKTNKKKILKSKNKIFQYLYFLRNDLKLHRSVLNNCKNYFSFFKYPISYVFRWLKAHPYHKSRFA